MTPQAPTRPFGLVVNPAAALGRAQRVSVAVRRELDRAGIPSVLISAASAAACQEAVREAALGLRGLILVGGDGLLGTVLQVPEARQLPIGVVPAGSGNDFARQFTLPSRPDKAVHRIVSALDAPRTVDLGVALRTGLPEHWFAGGLSIGFDAAINRRANALRLPIGPFRYAFGLIAEIVTLRARTFRVTEQGAEDAEPPEPTGNGEAAAESAPRTFTGTLCTVMNIRTLGGGIPITPQATVDDGRLDLIEVAAVRRGRLLGVLGTLARGRHASLPEVRMHTVQRVHIDAGAEIAYADGDEVGAGPFTVEVRPGAMQLLA